MGKDQVVGSSSISRFVLFLSVAAALAVPQRATAAASADLQLRAAAVTFGVGLPGRYFVSLTNQGPSSTNAPITFRADLPAGLSFNSISSPWDCSASGQQVTCTNVESLAAQSGTSFVFVVNVGLAAVPSVFTLLSIDYESDPDASDNSILKVTSVKPPRRPVTVSTSTPTATPSFGTPLPTRTPTRTATRTLTRTATSTPTPVPNATDLQLKKTNFGAFAVGRNGTYTLSVTNLGTRETNALLTIVDILPRGLAFVSGTGTEWTCSADASIVTCERIQPLSGLSTTNIALVVSVDDPAFPTVTNSAILSYAGDTDLSNNLARKPTTVRRLPVRTR